MTTKLDLLQTLLQNRNAVIIMYHGLALCSCGERFSDYSDIENHLVQKHEKLSEQEKVSSRKSFSFSDVLKDVVINNSGGGLSSAVNEAEQLDIALPPKSYAVCLDEKSIDGGRIENVNCEECSVTCWSFKTLKDHYLRQHNSWVCQETCRRIPRILFSKPSREHQNRLSKGWTYHYYCPIPGCKYHINQQVDPQYPKAFRSAALLRQHYSKIHACKSKICQKCKAAFSTEVFLRRHQKTACGRSFQCLTCQSVFSALENLQTHCRRKNHRFLQANANQNQTNVSEIKMEQSPPHGKAISRPKRRPLEDFSGRCSKYLKIAPMPSLTMTAAIALSELSSKTSALTKNEEKVEDKQPLWSASTQTSPRGGLMLPAPPPPEIPEESILPSRTSGGRPRLGDPKLEQFSTETQTDDLELLLKPSSASSASATNAADAFTIEAQTQFDLDDILCSNYTQTIFDTSLDPSTSGAPVNTAETQTSMLMSYDLVNMETQTLLFGQEEINS